MAPSLKNAPRLLDKQNANEVETIIAADKLDGKSYGVVHGQIVMVPPAFMRLLNAETEAKNRREVEKLMHSLRLVVLDSDSVSG